LSNNCIGKKGFLSAGSIRGVHGVRGEVKFHPHIEFLDFFEPGNSILIRTPAGAEETRKLAACRPHKKALLLAFEGVATREDAETLNGSTILIERSLLPGLEAGEYYWSDIIGLDVFSMDETYLGSVQSVIPTGSNDVYVVKNPETGRELLVPAIGSVIAEIDLAKAIIKVDIPKGL
jgi:16S rRNA processing protein RimM